MHTQQFTLIDQGRAVDVSAAVTNDTVRVPVDDVRAALGWELKSQGLCKGDRCVPTRSRVGLVDDTGIDLVALADLLEQPLAWDGEERVAYLGASAADRGAPLASLAAPEFTLPDLTGRMHSLSDYRGKKVLLVAYASW
jgi:hypothetical protein